MADGGERLREVVERERDLGRWLDVLPRYGQLQVDMAEDVERLLGLGLPDCRLETLASRYEELIVGVETVTVTESRRLRALVRRSANSASGWRQQAYPRRFSTTTSTTARFSSATAATSSSTGATPVSRTPSSACR